MRWGAEGVVAARERRLRASPTHQALYSSSTDASGLVAWVTRQDRAITCGTRSSAPTHSCAAQAHARRAPGDARTFSSLSRP